MWQTNDPSGGWSGRGMARRESGVAMRLLAPVLNQIVTDGRLDIIDPGGERHSFGPGATADVVVRFTDPALPRRILMNPSMAVGEAYMDGTLRIESGDLLEFLYLVADGADWENFGRLQDAAQRARTALRWLNGFNPAARARRNVAHHYDLSSELFDLFLDHDRQYSCAYFETPEADLEAAQLAKKRHLAAKLYLTPGAGQRVLDIGCGWGGLALYLGRLFDAQVTGLTLSQEQHSYANRRARYASLDDRVGVAMRDYRFETARYDRIVSVGMFEHVGLPQYPTFFNTVQRLLTDDGVAVLHSIGQPGRPSSTNPWIAKYIFPGGYIPALSEVTPHIERAGLTVTDVEILRLHYAETLRAWRQNFVANWERAKQLYDERFCRMWEFYLTIAEAGFRLNRLMVFQIQMAKRVDTLPMTRDYIQAAESWLRQRDGNVGVMPAAAAAE